MTRPSQSQLQRHLETRFNDAPNVPDFGPHHSALDRMAGRGSCRAFHEKVVSHAVLETLCAVALASPTKSDLQQRDIILVTSEVTRTSLADLMAGQAWVADAPTLVVFCGNNRRQRLLHAWQGIPFANDHLDAFFNASVDAGIALGAFITAAEAVGLGCCPISAIRNEAAAVSVLLGLPDHVFPVAGLAVGYPKGDAEIAKRLPLSVTLHHNRYSESNLQQTVATYDTDRAATQPYSTQRFAATFGQSDTYGWSEDKVRQYSALERQSFGAFVRAKGFRLD